MARAVPLLSAFLGAPPQPILFAADAQGVNSIDFGGSGIVAAEVSREDAERAWEKGAAGGHTVARLSGELSGLKNPEREIKRTIPFSILPPHLFSHETIWHDVDSKRWSVADHVTLGESRAVVRVSELIHLVAEAHGKTYSCLEDNQPTSGAMNKGRSPTVSLNFLCRKKAGRLLAANARLALLWVESRLMPADELSRVSNE